MSTPSVHHTISIANVALRGVLEAGIVAAFASWGWTVAEGAAPLSIALAVLAPAVAFGFWGAVDFRSAGRYGEPLRLTQELGVTLLAAAALYGTARPVLAALLLTVSLVHHAAVYLLGERLLKPQAA